MKRLLDLMAKLRVWGIAGVISYFRRRLNDRVQRRKLWRLHLASICKAPVRGITVIGELRNQMGLSKTLRDFVWSLKDTGIPVQTYDTTPKSRIPASDMVGLITLPDQFDLHRYSHIVMMYRSPLTKEMTAGHAVARIAFHDSAHGVHDTMPFLRESGDDIIAMSDFNFEYFRKAFPEQNVWKVTYPFRFKLANATPRDELRRKYNLAVDDFVVFFNFDFGSYYRKNIPAALEAFSLAFKGDSTAKLVFKTMGAKKNKKQQREMLAKVAELGIEAQFVHIADYLPRVDLDGLTGASDVYLSLHKSEGFGLGMAEAMSQGKPVVATNWSANTEFCRDDTAWCVPYKMIPILPREYPPSMVEWAAADVSEAARALREIRADLQAARARAANGAKFMKEHFSLENFKRDIDALLDERKGGGVGDTNDDIVHVALAANHRYVCGLKATFASMVNATRDKSALCFHIFDDGLTVDDRAELVELGHRFGYYETVNFIVPDMDAIKEKFSAFHGSHIPMLRLFFPEILSDLDWVLWADVDTLWFRDPKALWNLRDPSVSLLWARDIPSTRKWAKRIAKWRPDRDESRYACSGVVLMNLARMRKTGFVKQCYDFVAQWGTPLFPDQDIMNEICYDDCRFVDESWDCLYPMDNVESGLVLHFNCIGHLFDEGRYRGLFPLFEIWFRYYSEVVEGNDKTTVASWWKRGLWNLVAVFYPLHKLIAVVTDRVHPWVSDFIQRFMFFSWLRRKNLW